MNDVINKVKAFLFENTLISIIIGIFAALILFRGTINKMFVAPRRRRRSTTTRAASRRPAASKRRSYNSVIKSGVNKGKKAWQIKGSDAAKRRMAAIRRKRK